IYTILTINEMGGIPFDCPGNYNYTTPIVRTACQIRAANLVFMWLFQ
ncbi:17904_t:CDS:1, partial [Gigaspora rosea]